MPSIIDSTILNQVSNEFEIKDIQNIFELIITNLRGYLGIKPIEVVPKLSIEDGIAAVGVVFSRCYFSSWKKYVYSSC